MMASLILMVGFIGLIEAVTITSRAMDHARRQTMATQIITNEIEETYLASWSTISNLPTISTALAIDRQFWPTWTANTSYVVNRVVASNGAWYRCIVTNTGQPVTNTSYWTSVTSGLSTDIVVFNGATFTLARTVTSPDPVTNIRELNFVVTWTVTSSRLDASGNRVTTTHTCANSAWYGKNGLHLSYRQS